MYQHTASYTFSTLNLEPIRGYRKAYDALRFLPRAVRLISSKNINLKRTFHITDRYGHIFGLSGGDLQYPITQQEIRKISPFVVSLEDRRFFHHHGIDPKGVARALVRNVLARKIVQGGSTITQQLVRNTLLTPDRSLTRKLMEMILALLIEKYYSKHEILNLYCQSVYLGGGARGFGTAARLLYRRPLTNLSHDQICGLIGLLRSPSVTYPENSTKDFFSRQRLVMRVISNKTSLPIETKAPKAPSLNPIKVQGAKKPRLSHIIEQIIEREFGDIRSSVKRVTLTLDSKVQKTLDRVLQDASCDENISEASGVILENQTGEILAESSWQKGSESYFSPSFSGKIQPGSTFKTFALLSALEQGYTPQLELDSSPFESSFINDHDNNLWKVRNHAHIYRGRISLKDALIHSDNTVFARLSELLDIKGLLDTYARFRLSSTAGSNPSIVLGAITSGISLLQLASAYRAIARNGVFSEPQLLKFVELNDTVLKLKRPPDTFIADYDLAGTVKRILLGSGLSVGQIAFSGKTGTTSNGSLFAGYTDAISLAIWLGFNKPVNETETKAKTAKRILHDFATRILGYRSKLFSI